MTQREMCVVSDVLNFLESFEDDEAAALVTDPPYCAVGSASQATAKKYLGHRTKSRRTNFSGDTRDARSWLRWTTLWLIEAMRVVRVGGVVCIFCDWRQLPLATDALQCAGWIWGGIVPWNKTRAVRPRKGAFRSQCEYVIWGYRERLIGNPKVTIDGCITAPRRKAEREYHQVGKPEEVTRQLVQVAPVGDLVIDPFMGGGSVGAGCLREGRRFAGGDRSAHSVTVSRERLAALAK